MGGISYLLDDPTASSRREDVRRLLSDDDEPIQSLTTGAGTTTLTYDYEDRVTGISYPSSATNAFAYNGLDTRVGKTDSSGTSTYKRDGAEVSDPLLSDGSIAYTPGISERKTGASTLDHSNYLGTFTRQTNASQSTTSTRVYDAFGNLESSTGTPQSPFGFVGGQGYQEDGDSGLKLLGHRLYDPSTGRFLTRDPAKNGRNWFCYCDANPLGESDPEGFSPDPDPDPDPIGLTPPPVYRPPHYQLPMPPLSRPPGPGGQMPPVPPSKSFPAKKPRPPLGGSINGSGATGRGSFGPVNISGTVDRHGHFGGGFIVLSWKF